MGKPTAQNNNFINHFSHPHPLQLTPVTSSPPCFACKLTGGNNLIYSCRPCNFSLHETCSKMKQIITHPSHPAHTLSLLVSPVYDGGYFSCDGCGIIGTGFSYQCSRCDFDIHALCAYKPVVINHKSHPQHGLELAFHSPYGANKGFSCDICRQIGKNQWLYRCIPCEFDAHVGCVSAQPQPHLLQHSSSVPTPHTHHPGRPRHQNSLPMPSQASNMPQPRLMSRPRPVGNPNRSIRVQNPAGYGPRGQNNNVGFNGQVGLIGANEIVGQERESIRQGSMEGSGYEGSVGTELEFDVAINVEVEYEGGEDGEANDEGEDAFDTNGLEIVAYGDESGVARSESEFGGSSDARSQGNDLSDDLYPLSLDNTQGPTARIKQGSGGGRGKKKNSNQAARSSNKSLSGSSSGTQSPVRSQTGRVSSVRTNRPRATAFNGPPGVNVSLGGSSSNVIDNGGNNDSYYNNNNEADVYGVEVNIGVYEESYGNDNGGGNNDSYYNNNNEADVYGVEVNIGVYDESNGNDNVGGYDENYGGDYAGECDFQVEGEFVSNGYDDQAYDEAYDENDFAGGSEYMYDGTMDGSQYSGVNNEPNYNVYLPVVGTGQVQYGQTGRPRNMGRGRGGTTNMNMYRNMNQGGNNVQPRSIGGRGQYRPNARPYRVNGGPYVPNGPNGNILMNPMVQNLAMNMLIGGGVNGDAGDGGVTSIMGGLFGGDSGF